MRVLLFFLVLLVVLIQRVTACICYPPSVTEYLAQNDTLPQNQQVLILKGVVHSVEDSLIINKFGYGKVVQVEVLEYWPQNSLKFMSTPYLTIFNDELDCGVSFKKDSTYLIRAYSFNRYLATSECEGTKLLSQSSEDVKELGSGSVLKLDQVNHASVSENEFTENEIPRKDNAVMILLIISVLINVFLAVIVVFKNR